MVNFNIAMCEFKKALRVPEIKERIKKMSFYEKMIIDDLFDALTNKNENKLYTLIESLGGREAVSRELGNYGINFEAISTASGIF